MIRMRDDDERGSAGFSLVAVLVFMLIVSAIVVPFAITAKTRLMIANNEVEQERLSLLAEGLANVASSELANGSGTEKLPLDFSPTACRSGKFTFDVRIQDHSGLIDLNAADVHLLSLGFASLGFNRQISEELAEAAIRFRGSTNAFAAQEESASSVGPPQDKQAPFESVSELQEFSALASTPLYDLYAVFTVNSKRGTLSLDHAPSRLRTVLAGAAERGASTTQGATEASAYTVEIAAKRDGSGIAGHAGFVIEKFPASAAGFRRLSRSPAAEIPDLAATTSSGNCDALFGTEAAQILRGWAS
ncbi:general secretion pathway protein GspK [Mesorhizobium sp. LMG 17147]|uniref:general secretion pathway protein GspK n=1 Tax=Mesorhizobium sp. LMG 17147 TaxID=2963091 RepID=UPI0020C9735D|nr:general secretion pathway protein GspK [Mesorhizobium sp. LMG 17147]MCP9229984.1 general secretion pathway protein GspK [Mesorhizobium sp. LMG 17147]